ncbi:uncharacterized protein LOC143880805 [Tasmannia lanceolata]|uniref:uncharacterized protein LOC143880805 n=1 Tax=Tasmannia lanceolata TaxID=3420 RepID=UPI0040649D03
MSKEEDFNFLKIQTWILKVNIDCYGCKKKVKKLLQKIDGVYTITMDSEQGKVIVSGNVDPSTLIKKLAKSGKHAELLDSKGGNNQLNNQFQNIQIENDKGQKDGKDEKGGKDQKGAQQQQMKGLKDLMEVPQFKDLKQPNLKDQKSVKFSLPEEDDLRDDGFVDVDVGDEMGDGFVDALDDEHEELLKDLKMKPMNDAMNAQIMNDKKGDGGNGGKKSGGDVNVQNSMGMGGKNDAKKGNGWKKKWGGNKERGQNQGGGGGAKNGAENGGGGNTKIADNIANGGGGGNNKNEDNVANDGGGSNNVPGGKNGGEGKIDGGNVGQMGNIPAGHVGNIPAVQGVLAMNFQGAGPEIMAGNPYQQQYMAAMMHARRPVAYYPYPPPESYTFFSDENTNSCSVM